MAAEDVNVYPPTPPFFLPSSSIWKIEWQKEEERDNLSPLYCLSALSHRGWGRLKPGAITSIHGSHLGGKDVTIWATICYISESKLLDHKWRQDHTHLDIPYACSEVKVNLPHFSISLVLQTAEIQSVFISSHQFLGSLAMLAKQVKPTYAVHSFKMLLCYTSNRVLQLEPTLNQLPFAVLGYLILIFLVIT